IGDDGKDCNGQQCCYNSSGRLVPANKTGASFSYRAHQEGCNPYKSAGKVPWLSHLLIDVFPYYHCCLRSDTKTCNYFRKLRPAPDCAGYVAPTIGLCTGDPHILTFDGNMYTFNGLGEFQMVEVGDRDVVLQSRNAATASESDLDFVVAQLLSSKQLVLASKATTLACWSSSWWRSRRLGEKQSIYRSRMGLR
ncbi:putative sushi domain-containing protein 2-like, partial [Apostichopus japonicus]